MGQRLTAKKDILGVLWKSSELGGRQAFRGIYYERSRRNGDRSGDNKNLYPSSCLVTECAVSLGIK